MVIITKETSVSIDDVLHLYQAVGWTNYTNQPQMLEQALSHTYKFKDVNSISHLTGDLQKILSFMED